MFLAHSFRLRDPWQCEQAADGATRWSRVFHRPTGMEPDDDLWLVCSGLPSGAAVSLNNQRLPLPPDVRKCAPGMGATGVPPVRSRADPTITSGRSTVPSLPNQFDVTPILADANRIEIVIPADLQPPAHSLQPSPRFPYDVRLGIVGHS